MKRITNFQAMIASVKGRPKKTVVVAGAADADVLAATVQASQEGLADFLYVGDPAAIHRLAAAAQSPLAGAVLAASDAQAAGQQALALLKAGQAHVLMKGKIPTHDLLGLVLKDADLKKQQPDQFLSHLAIFEWAQQLKLFSDPALNIDPSLEQKRRITLNALAAAYQFGIAAPRVAFLSAVETVNPKMRSSVEAAELARLDWGAALAAGPLAFDGTLFPEACRAKGITSPVAGQADILIFPNLEAANTFYKVLAWMVKPDLAGVIVGAAVPIILTSRADSDRVKFCSIAATLYLAP